MNKKKNRPKGGKMSQLGGNYSGCITTFSICGRKKAKKKANQARAAQNENAEARANQADAADPPFLNDYHNKYWDEEKECCMVNSEGKGGANPCVSAISHPETRSRKTCTREEHGIDSCRSQSYARETLRDINGNLTSFGRSMRGENTGESPCRNILDCGDMNECPRRNDEAESLEDE
jgi:hypothetical protein